jgi:hypothetical protein
MSTDSLSLTRDRDRNRPHSVWTVSISSPPVAETQTPRRSPPPRRGTDGGRLPQHGCAPSGSGIARASCWLGRRSSPSPSTLGARPSSGNGAATQAQRALAARQGRPPGQRQRGRGAAQEPAAGRLLKRQWRIYSRCVER